MEFPPNEAMVFVGSAKPIRCLISSYYQDANFLEMTKTTLTVKRGPEKIYKSEWETDYVASNSEELKGLIIEYDLRAEDEVLDNSEILESQDNEIGIELEEVDEVA
jgi:hypothetical protein